MSNPSRDAARGAAQQHDLINVAAPSAASPRFATNPHPDARWFDAGNLGLFVHWGIASVHGQTDLSWGMIKDTPWSKPHEPSVKISPAEYYALADRFHPDRYEPERWLSAARDAGCTYAVLTTKHHDGYTLWPTATSEIGVHTHLGGRDLVRPFVEACRALDLKVGLYYSPPDWHFERDHLSFEFESFKALEMARRRGDPPPDVTAIGWNYEPVVLPPYPADLPERFAARVRVQIEELLTRYGKVDLMWFDGRPYPLGTPGEITVERIRELQPSILLNPRLLGGGDYAAFECRMPEARPEGRWEHCDLLHACGWGFHRDARFWPAEHQVGKLARIREWGGNFLVNAGLGPDGEMPPAYYETMAEIRRLSRA